MMIYRTDGHRIQRQLWQAGEELPDNTIWIDMYNPTRRQEQAVEAFLNIDVPTREEMHAIEVSDRLYQENGAHYLTATLATKTDTQEPESHAVTFIIANNVLVTLRYSDPLPFAAFANLVEKMPAADHNGPAVMLGLLDSITNRVADVLERISHDIDAITHEIFRPAKPSGKKRAQPIKYQQMLERIGHSGDLMSKVRESLMTLSRLVAFATQCNKITVGENQSRLLAQGRDISGLTDHVSFLSNKINFLLDATLGMISIEQNGTIKIFSVAAVIFLPPTLLASIYGMNFVHMPELQWHYGYPFALGMMILSGLMPYAYFKRKKWL